jgi:hypothetical protein
MNRRGHVGTVLMVFGALLLVMAALYSFYGFKTEIRLLDADFRGLSLQTRDIRYLFSNKITILVSESVKLSTNSVNFKEDFRKNLMELSKKERDSFKEIQNNVFAKLVNGQFTVEPSGEIWVLSVKDLFFSLNAENSVSSSEYKFNIESNFDKQKVISLNFKAQ